MGVKFSAATRLPDAAGLVFFGAERAAGAPTTDYFLKHNFSASSDPTVNDDSGDGYSLDSLWFRQDNGKAFKCFSASVGAAVWQELGPYIGPSTYVANTYHHFQDCRIIPGGTAVTAAQDVIKLFPIVGRSRFTLTELGTRIGTGSGNMQFAAYAMDPSTNRPTGNALGSTSNVDTSTAGNKSGALSASVAMWPGRRLWIALNSSNATVTTSAAETDCALLCGTTTLANIVGSAGVKLNALSFAQTFNTWPDLTGQSFTDIVANTHFMFHRVG